MGIIELPLKHGICTFDEEDEELVMNFYGGAAQPRKWYSYRDGNNCYVRANYLVGAQRKIMLMHRYILGESCLGEAIDHRDGIGLHNQRSNLQVGTQINRLNRGPNKNNKLGLKGIRQWKNGFVVEIGVNSKAYHIGFYKTLAEAIPVRDQAYAKYHGEFARTEPFKR